MTVSHMFIQDVPAMGVPDLDHVNRVDIFKPFKYKQKLRKVLEKVQRQVPGYSGSVAEEE
jgi:hypothetical protein